DVMHWFLFQIYLGTAAAKPDSAIRSWLPKIAADRRVRTWHFIRYVDTRGPHLRVRVAPKPGCEKYLKLDVLEHLTTALSHVGARTSVAPCDTTPRSVGRNECVHPRATCRSRARDVGAR